MKSLSNLPPGVSDWMIPGNRPEDQDIDIGITITVGDVYTIREWLRNNKKNSELKYLLEDILSQIEAQYPHI